MAMTANASDKDRDECLDAGMDGFLSKPVLKDRLAEVRRQPLDAAVFQLGTQALSMLPSHQHPLNRTR